MTFKEAKEIFLNRGYEHVEGGSIYNADKWRDSVIVISDWLKQEQADAVSRADAIEVVNHMLMGERNHKIVALEELKQLSSVQPQPKTGHWFIDERPESDREIICSNCEQPIFRYHKLDFDYRPNYCPNCGAKMVEPQESEDGNDYIC